MIQVKPFVIANAGTTKYMCLSNVRKGYGIPALHEYAYLDWQNNVQHKDQNFPSGCSVPVYFNWNGAVGGVTKNWGHIAVRLADGRIWTDGKYYANVNDLSKNYIGGQAYLGWGELVNNVRVVTQGDTMATINDDVSRQIGWHFMGRNGYDGKPNALQSKQGDIYGKTLDNATISAFFLSAEAREWRDSRVPKIYAERDALRATNTNLNAQVTQLTKAVAEKQKTIDGQSTQIIGLTQTVNEKQAEINVLQDTNSQLTKENAELKAIIATGGAGNEDTEWLNKLGEVFMWFIKRIGIKK